MPVDVSRRKRDSGFAGSEDSRQLNGDSSHRSPSAPVVVPETETGTLSSATTEECPTVDADSSGDHGGGTGLDRDGSTSTHALVDDDDVDRELDAGTKAALASGGGAEEALGSIEAEGGSTATAEILADRGGLQENGGAGAKDDLDNAGNDGEAYPNNRKQTGYRSRSSNLASRGFARASDDETGDNGRRSASDRGVFGLQHGGFDRNSCSSTELTLGRPDPTSVHWKFSRRLLQT